VGEMKLRMMRKQMEFRKGILSKEWEHAQMKMKLRHMQQELYSYRRLKVTVLIFTFFMFCPRRKSRILLTEPLFADGTLRQKNFVIP
jgi:hypothetical protein